MAMVKTVALSALFCGLRYSECPNPSHHHKTAFEYCYDQRNYYLTNFIQIFDVLEKKDTIAFSYAPLQADINAPKPTIEDFFNATHYTYDENTLFWIIHYEKLNDKTCYNDLIGPMRNKLVKLLADAGIVQHTGIYDKSSIIVDLMNIETDENIFWLIDVIGLVPNGFCYWQYGRRNDRTFQQKYQMFQTLHAKYKIDPDTRCLWSNCYSFSSDPNEVIAFIKFFIDIGIDGTDDLFIYGFKKFGVVMFPTLKDLNIPVDDPIRVIQKIRYTEKSGDLQNTAITWLSVNYPNIEPANKQ